MHPDKSVRMFFDLFQEPKMRFRNNYKPLKREKRSQNQNLMAENDTRLPITRRPFSVSSEINYALME
jgi:hypothetical protein